MTQKIQSRFLNKLPGLWLVCAALCSPTMAIASNDPVGNGTSGQAATKNTSSKIYKSLQGGTPSFSDVPPTSGAYSVYRPSCYACAVNSSVDWHTTQLHRDAFAQEISQAVRLYALDPALVRAVIHAESGFNARARSHKGALGLMQLMPGTARMLGVAQPDLPANNILGGTQYLASLLARFKNDIALATAAYNAGPMAVQRHAGVPPYPETQVYVQRVKILYQRYRDPVPG